MRVGCNKEKRKRETKKRRKEATAGRRDLGEKARHPYQNVRLVNLKKKTIILRVMNEV